MMKFKKVEYICVVRQANMGMSTATVGGSRSRSRNNSMQHQTSLSRSGQPSSARVDKRVGSRNGKKPAITANAMARSAIQIYTNGLQDLREMKRTNNPNESFVSAFDKSRTAQKLLSKSLLAAAGTRKLKKSATLRKSTSAASSGTIKRSGKLVAAGRKKTSQSNSRSKSRFRSATTGKHMTAANETSSFRRAQLRLDHEVTPATRVTKSPAGKSVGASSALRQRSVSPSSADRRHSLLADLAVYSRKIITRPSCSANNTPSNRSPNNVPATIESHDFYQQRVAGQLNLQNSNIKPGYDLNEEDLVFVLQQPSSGPKQQNFPSRDFIELQEALLEQRDIEQYLSHHPAVSSFQFDQVLDRNLRTDQNKDRHAKLYAKLQDALAVHYQQKQPRNLVHASLHTLPSDFNQSKSEMRQRDYGKLLNFESASVLAENVVYQSVKAILKEQKRCREQSTSRCGVDLSVILLYKGEMYDLLQRPQDGRAGDDLDGIVSRVCSSRPSVQHQFIGDNSGIKSKKKSNKLTFQTCCQEVSYSREGHIYEFSQQFKRLAGQLIMNVQSKADVLKAIKHARSTKSTLAQKFNVDINQFTKSSAIIMKVNLPGCTTSSLNPWDVASPQNDFSADDSQFVFVEMPSNNLINGYNSLDPVKKFVFESHKSLQMMLKFLQARDPQQPYSAKQVGALKTCLLSMLLQESLLFTGPCEAVVSLSIPSETHNWRAALLGLKLVSKMRAKTRQVQSQQLNQDIISHTLDTVEQELTMVDTNLLSILNHSRRSRGPTPAQGEHNLSDLQRPSSHLTAGTGNELLINESENYDAEMRRHERLRDLIASYRSKVNNLRAQNQESSRQKDIHEEVLAMQRHIQSLQQQLNLHSRSENVTARGAQAAEKFDDQLEWPEMTQNVSASDKAQKIFDINSEAQYSPFIAPMMGKMASPPELYDQPVRPAHVQNLAEFQDTDHHQIMTSFGCKDYIIQTAQHQNRVSFSPSSLRKDQKQSVMSERVETLGVSQSKDMVGQPPETDITIQHGSTNEKMDSAPYVPLRGAWSRSMHGDFLTNAAVMQNVKRVTSKSSRASSNQRQRSRNDQRPPHTGTRANSKSKKRLAAPATQQSFKKKTMEEPQRQSALTRLPAHLKKVVAPRQLRTKSSISRSMSSKRRQQAVAQRLCNPTISSYLKISSKYEPETIRTISIESHSRSLRSAHRNVTTLKSRSSTLSAGKRRSIAQKASIKKGRVQQLMSDLKKESAARLDHVYSTDQQVQHIPLNDAQRRVDFSFDDLRRQHNHSAGNKSDNYVGVNHHPVGTQDSQFYSNVVGNTIQTYANPLQKGNDSGKVEAPLTCALKPLITQGSRQMSAQLSGSNLASSHKNGGINDIVDCDSVERPVLQNSSFVGSRRASDYDERRSSKGRDAGQMARDIKLKDIEIEHLKQNLKIAQQVTASVEKSLRKEVREVSSLLTAEAGSIGGIGASEKVQRKMQELLDWKIKSKVKKSQLLLKLQEERRQRKRVQAQRDLMLQGRRGNSSKKRATRSLNMSVKSARRGTSRGKERQRSSKSKSSKRVSNLNQTGRATRLSDTMRSRKQLSNKNNRSKNEHSCSFSQMPSQVLDHQDSRASRNKLSERKSLSFSNPAPRPQSALGARAAEKRESKLGMSADRTPSMSDLGKIKLLKNSASNKGSKKSIKSGSKDRNVSVGSKRSLLELAKGAGTSKLREICKLLEEENATLTLLNKKREEEHNDKAKELMKKVRSQKDLLMTSQAENYRLRCQVDGLQQQQESMKHELSEMEGIMAERNQLQDKVRELTEQMQAMQEAVAAAKELDSRMVIVEQARDKYRRESMQMREENKELERQIKAMHKSSKAQGFHLSGGVGLGRSHEEHGFDDTASSATKNKVY